MRVTLVWSDAPGPTTGGVALVNDLDLEVTVNGVVYKGNVFSGRNSVTGGSFDRRNTVENVFLPAGTERPGSGAGHRPQHRRRRRAVERRRD